MYNRKPKNSNPGNTKKPVLSKSQLERIAGKTKKEADIEKMVCEAVIPAGWQPLKFFSPFSTGWPDRILLTPCGRTLWCEFKAPTGTYKRLQELNRSWLVSNDHAYYCIHTVEAAHWFINKVVPLVANLNR